ncbi:hypothetical protein [Longimicrobium sp.]|uniref:hypothetical protein n=1 Tax=Longimicrobium sp. TaxID=2029185 RepID=UPI002E31092E|nr:hypothetical protein [Longimicrobium sp.]HEX6037350.1 hypothetical protein [Longimicrobium sp.]
MNYGRDYGNRNFLDRAANTVRGWLGNRGGHDYDNGYRGGMRGGWDEGRGGYREMGDVNGHRGWQGGMEHGYGAANWNGRNADWNRGDMGGGWGRGTGDAYRTGGYQPQHGAWDVDWDDDDRSMRGGMQGRMSAGMMGSAGGRYDRGYMQGAYDRDMGRGMHPRGGGMMGRGMQGGMNRYDRDMDRNRSGGMGNGGMMGRDADMGDVGGGTIGNYGAYGSYGIERFRSGSSGGVPTGQYWTGYGHGTGYRG